MINQKSKSKTKTKTKTKSKIKNQTNQYNQRNPAPRQFKSAEGANYACCFFTSGYIKLRNIPIQIVKAQA